MKISDLSHFQIKKSSLLHICVLLSCCGFSTVAFAQLPNEQREVPSMNQLPQEQRQLAISYDDKIEKNELPQGIHDSVNENYSGFEVSEVYRGSDGSYKIKMEKGDQKAAIFYSAQGEFLRLEEDNCEDKVKVNEELR